MNCITGVSWLAYDITSNLYSQNNLSPYGVTTTRHCHYHSRALGNFITRGHIQSNRTRNLSSELHGVKFRISNLRFIDLIRRWLRMFKSVYFLMYKFWNKLLSFGYNKWHHRKSLTRLISILLEPKPRLLTAWQRVFDHGLNGFIFWHQSSEVFLN